MSKVLDTWVRTEVPREGGIYLNFETANGAYGLAEYHLSVDEAAKLINKLKEAIQQLQRETR